MRMIRPIPPLIADRVDVSFIDADNSRAMVRFALTLEGTGELRTKSNKGLSYYYDWDCGGIEEIMESVKHHTDTLKDELYIRSNKNIILTNFTSFYDQYHLGLYISKEFHDKYSMSALLHTDHRNSEVSVAWLGFYPMMHAIIELMKPQSSNE